MTPVHIVKPYNLKANFDIIHSNASRPPSLRTQSTVLSPPTVDGSTIYVYSYQFPLRFKSPMTDPEWEEEILNVLPQSVGQCQVLILGKVPLSVCAP